MTPQEFAKSVTFLNMAYGKEMDDTRVGVWYNFFQNVPVEKFNLAIVRIIEKSQYFPSIAEIKQELAILENPTLQLDASEEWSKVTKAISRYGAYRAVEAMESMHPVTADVVKRLGGFVELCRCEDIEWRRKSFMSIFKETLDRHMEIAVYSGNQLTETERKRQTLVNMTVKQLESKIGNKKF